jgi:hypothetical protein
MSQYGEAAPDANLEPKGTFRIELDNIQIMAFEKCVIGGIEWTVMESRTGIDPLMKQRSSGFMKPIDITLTKKERTGGAADVNVMIAWAMSGSSDRRSGAVIELDRDGAEIRRLNFNGAWISKYTPSESDAENETDARIHEFVLAVGGFSWA